MMRTTAPAPVHIRTLRSFDDPALSPARWDRLAADASGGVFLTYAWQRLWWSAMAEDPLLIVVAERRGEPFAIAPLYAAAGTLMLVGSGSADYLDFAGHLDEAALASLLRAARDALPDFSGIKLYHLRGDSATCALLPGVAARLGLELYCEEEVGAPYADLTDPGVLRHATERRKLRKEEARMRRAGALATRSADAAEAGEMVEVFLAQHSSRWRALGQESFERPGSRELIRDIVDRGVRDGWARLTVLEWRGATVALDISLRAGATQLSWLVSRDHSIREHSPGTVLAGYVARDAVAAGMRRLDLGLGEEEYKLHGSSGVTRIANWFMYP
jgi:CelD/BcsL family acetyltransferase involved in cellulose biosynthesis